MSVGVGRKEMARQAQSDWRGRRNDAVRLSGVRYC